MLALYLYMIGGIFGYLGIGALIGGYLCRTYDNDDWYENDVRGMRIALLWLSICLWPTVIPIYGGKVLGNKIGDYKLAKEKERAIKKEEQKRIAEKTRIEIDAIIQEEVEAELKQNHVA